MLRLSTQLRSSQFVKTRRFSTDKKWRVDKIRKDILAAKTQLMDGILGVTHDWKAFWQLRKDKGSDTYNYTFVELVRRRKHLTSIGKFIPYSILLVMPMGAPMIALYTYLFPNAVPAPFLTPDMKKKRIAKKQLSQQNAKTALLQSYSNPEFWAKFDSSDYKARSSQLTSYLSQPISSKFDLSALTSKELEEVAQIMRMDYISGGYILNQLLSIVTRLPLALINYLFPLDLENNKLYNYELCTNSFPGKHIKRALLLWQIRRRIRILKCEDARLAEARSQLDLLNEQELNKVFFERGLAKCDRMMLVNSYLDLSIESGHNCDLFVLYAINHE